VTATTKGLAWPSQRPAWAPRTRTAGADQHRPDTAPGPRTAGADRYPRIQPGRDSGRPSGRAGPRHLPPRLLRPARFARFALQPLVIFSWQKW